MLRLFLEGFLVCVLGISEKPATVRNKYSDLRWSNNLKVSLNLSTGQSFDFPVACSSLMLLN